MVWWLWILLGLALLFAEMAAPGGFFALFFGLSGLLVGGAVAMGWAGGAAMQWLLFSGVSVAALLLLRAPLKARLNLTGNRRPVDSLVGEEAVIVEDVPGGGVGKVELRGASWNARSAGGAALGRGLRCRVERVEGLTLWVRAD